MLYFKFQYRHRKKEIPVQTMKEKNLCSRICFILNKYFNADPDFFDKLGYVAIWYLEYDEKCDEPFREIGIDSSGKIIVKMPDERNYGYWVDTNCDLQFFKKFNIQMITEQEFNNLWNSVDYDRKKGEFKPVHSL